MKKTNDLLAAVRYAAHMHRNQRRKDAGKTPYINHPIDVMFLLSDAGIDDHETLIGAVLHDTIEDTGANHSQLAYKFGRLVADLVVEVSDDKTLDPGERKRLQITHAASLSPRAKLIKIADKICNVRDLIKSAPPSWDTRRKIEYVEWACQVVYNLGNINTALRAMFVKVADEAKHAILGTIPGLDVLPTNE